VYVALKREDAERLTIIVNSDAYDRVNYALSIAKVGAAQGMDVHMLFTFGGLRRLVRGRADELGEETGVVIRASIEKGLAVGSVAKISEQIKDAKKLGVNIYACVSAMAVLGLSKDDLVKEVDGILGISTFLDLSRGAVPYYV